MSFHLPIGFFLALGIKYGPKLTWAIVGAVLAPVAMIVMAWLVQMNVLGLSGKVLRQIVCVTTGPLLALLVLLAVAAGVPARRSHMERLDLGRCQVNLQALRLALDRYAVRHPGQVAPNLDVLVDGTKIKSNHLECPGRESGGAGYLYVDIPNEEDGTKKIRLWDRRSNHADYRQVIYADGRFARVKEAEFAKLLELDENAAARDKDQKDQ